MDTFGKALDDYSRQRLVNWPWDVAGLIAAVMSFVGWWLAARTDAAAGPVSLALVLTLAVGGGLGLGGLRRGGLLGQVSGLAAIGLAVVSLWLVYLAGHPIRVAA